MEIPTLKIAGENGDYILINESDFDESKHKLFAGGKIKLTKTEVETEVEKPVKKSSSKNKKS